MSTSISRKLLFSSENKTLVAIYRTREYRLSSKYRMSCNSYEFYYNLLAHCNHQQNLQKWLRHSKKYSLT